MGQQFAPPDYIDDIGTVISFLGGLQQVATNTGHASQNTTAAAQALMDYVIGSSPTSADGFDGIVAALKSSWSGKAADAFYAQTDTVRTFGIGVAALMDSQTNVAVYGSQTPAQDMYHLTAGPDYGAATQALQQVLQDTYNRYKAASDPNSGSNFAHWTGFLKSTLRNNFWNQGGNDVSGPLPPTVTVNVPNFEEWVEGPAKDSSGNATGSARLTLSTQKQAAGFQPATSQVSYRNPKQWDPLQPNGFDFPITWNYWGVFDQGGKDNEIQDTIGRLATEPEQHTYYRKIIIDLGKQYQQIYTPMQQDESQLPKGTSNSQTQYPGGYPGGPGGGFGPLSSGSLDGTGGLPGTSAFSPGSYSPGAYSPGAYSPSAAGPSPAGAGGWNPSSLAGFNPAGAGGGVGAGGLGPGTGLSGGAGLGAASGLSAGAGADGAAGLGTGAGGANGGLAGAAGRAMPMAPMAGAGAAKSSDGRQRAVYLTEDEDVWGADSEGGSAVL